MKYGIQLRAGERYIKDRDVIVLIECEKCKEPLPILEKRTIEDGRAVVYVVESSNHACEREKDPNYSSLVCC